MRRREFIRLGVGAAATTWPYVAQAQRRSTPVIGFLSARSPAEAVVVLRAFHEGLGELGYVEGKNVAFEYRWAEGRYDRLPELAIELAARQVKADMTDSTVTARVGIGREKDEAVGLTVTLHINLPHVAPGAAKDLALAAHHVCPYSRATRGNIPVELRIAD